MTKKLIDTSQELSVYRYREGIKLIRPDKKLGAKESMLMSATRFSVSHMLNFPFGVYFYNQNSIFQNINQRHAESCGFDSEQQALGKTVFNTSLIDYAENLIQHNKTVLATQKMNILDEEIVHFDGTYNRGLSIKLPWYNHENKVIGVVGYTAVVNKHSLADALSQLISLGILRSHSDLKMEKNDLTPREKEILNQLIRGRTAKRIATVLNLSPRTIEKYIEAIKYKMNVFSKAELIEKVLEEA